MSDWNYGELINRRPHSHSVASNSTQPMETELSREREAHNKTKRERDEARENLERIHQTALNARKLEEDYAEWEKAVLALLDLCELQLNAGQ